jgi:hypothetical protein
MRAVALLVALAALAPAWPRQAPDKQPVRYGVEADLEKYPQDAPPRALASVVKAIQGNQIGYLLAQLSDPAFVDKRVQEVHGGKFEEMVRETMKKLADNPAALKELQRFAKEAEWDPVDDTAMAQLKDVKDRRVFMRKIQGRWYLENRQK